MGEATNPHFKIGVKVGPERKAFASAGGSSVTENKKSEESCTPLSTAKKTSH